MILGPIGMPLHHPPANITPNEFWDNVNIPYSALLPLRLRFPRSPNPATSRLQERQFLGPAHTELGAHTRACTNCRGTHRQLLSPSLSHKAQWLEKHSVTTPTPMSHCLRATCQSTPRTATACTRATRTPSAAIWMLPKRGKLRHRLQATASRHAVPRHHTTSQWNLRGV